MDDEVQEGTTEINKKKPSVWPLYLASISAALGAFCCGMVTSWTQSENLHINYTANTNSTYLVSAYHDNWMISIMFISAAISSLFSGNLANTFGRQRVLLLSIIPSLIGWIVIIINTNLIFFYIGRILHGIMLGIVSTVLTLYTSEIACTFNTGFLGTFYNTFTIAGCYSAQILGYYFRKNIHPIICLVAEVAFFCIFAPQPETPVYLLKKGKLARARKVLQYLRGSSCDITEEFETFQVYVEKMNRVHIVYEVLMQSITKRALYISCMLLILRQMNGLQLFLTQLDWILENFPPNFSVVNYLIILGIVSFVSNLVCGIIVDWVGRKTLLLVSVFMIFLVLISVGILQTLRYRYTIILSEKLYVYILCQLFYIVGFSLGLGGIPFVLPPILAPPEIKGFVVSIASSINWLVFSISQKCLIQFVEKHNDLPFYGYGFIMFIGLLYVYFWVPETKDVSFTDMPKLLKKQKKMRKHKIYFS